MIELIVSNEFYFNRHSNDLDDLFHSAQLSFENFRQVPLYVERNKNFIQDRQYRVVPSRKNWLPANHVSTDQDLIAYLEFEAPKRLAPSGV